MACKGPDMPSPADILSPVSTPSHLHSAPPGNHASQCSCQPCKTRDGLGDVQVYSNALDAEGSEQASAQTVGQDMVKPTYSFL